MAEMKPIEPDLVSASGGSLQRDNMDRCVLFDAPVFFYPARKRSFYLCKLLIGSVAGRCRTLFF